MISFSIIFCIYFLLFSFWSGIVLNLKISGFKGLSLMNMGIYLSLILWGLVIVKRKKLLEFNEVYKYLLAMVFIVIISIPTKMLIGEFQRVRVFSEIILLKNWSEGFLLFIILYNLFEQKELCLKTIWALVTLFMFCNLTMLLDWFGIINIASISTNRLGESSGFGNPNDYAAYMLLFFPILFSAFFSNRRKLVKSSYFFCLIISMMSFLMTGSRGGFLAFLAGSLFYLILINSYLLKSGATKLIKYGLILLAILLFSILLLPKSFYETMVTNIVPNEIEEMENYSHGREKFWIGGLKIFADRPILGHGQNTFKLLLEKKEGISATAHNRYLLYLVEFGLIGLVAYLLIQFSLLKQVYKVLKFPIKNTEKLLFINFFVGLLSYLIALFFVDGTNSDIPLWIYTAAICRYTRFEKIKNEDSINSQPLNLKV